MVHSEYIVSIVSNKEYFGKRLKVLYTAHYPETNGRKVKNYTEI